MREIVERFCPAESGEVVLSTLGTGNINDTWLVRAGGRELVLQRLNPVVFPRPELIMANLAVLSRHLEQKKEEGEQRWEQIALLPTISGEPFYRDSTGVVWRAMTYIAGTVTHQEITSSVRAREVGWALGRFHRLLADLPMTAVSETLQGFHVLPGYLAQFDQICREASPPDSPELRFCLEFVEQRRTAATLLEQERQEGRIRMQVVHGDPKAANVLFDSHSNQAVSLIDLDTVGPGLVLSDIGDCLRSCCNPAGEQGDPSQVEFDLGLCRALLAGYLSEAGGDLWPRERELIGEGARLIAFELGLRFLTDHLAGDRYFKISRPGQNLQRALVQFHLTRSIERQLPAISRFTCP